MPEKNEEIGTILGVKYCVIKAKIVGGELFEETWQNGGIKQFANPREISQIII